jgi:amidase
VDDLTYHSATELCAALRARTVSSRELLEAYLKRVERLDPAINAVVTLDVERATIRARELDERAARGDWAGPLHGLPVTVKDSYETAGLRTTCGAPEYAEHVPERNAVAVQRLIDAGAIVFGKTNVPAYCADVQTYNKLFGTTRNPHDPSRSPGGSSGGAAAALACGFTALELGSDIGGSIRTPAHFCGVFGHKPTFGLVPQRGHIPGPPGALAESDLNVCGPLSRSADDLALALSVVAGPDETRAKAFRLSLPPPRHDSLADYRLALWLDEPAFPIDHAVREVLESAAAALRAVGARIDERGRPDLTLAEIVETYQRLLHPVEASGLPPVAFERLIAAASAPKTGDRPDDAYTHFARSATAHHRSWLAANERRLRHAARMAAFFERYDALLCPVSPVPAIAHDHEGSPLTRTITVDREPRPYMDLLAWIAPATSAYLPASVVPAGRTPAGLPVGLQIVGPYLEDATTIDLARRIAEVTGGFAPPRL